MALSEFVYKTIEEQLEICLALDDVALTETAKKIAYYNAMIDAAQDDPFDDAEEQEEILDYFKSVLKELTETYQGLVNDLLP